MKNKIYPLFLFCILMSFEFMAGPALAVVSKDIGEVFGRPVSQAEFDYYYKTAAIFTRTGKSERTEEETRSEAWQNLIFIHDAREQHIDVDEDELKAELKRLMAEKNIEYGGNEYSLWVLGQFNEKTEIFERRIRELLIINKYMKLKTNPEVTVTEDEMRQKYLNQYIIGVFLGYLP